MSKQTTKPTKTEKTAVFIVLGFDENENLGVPGTSIPTWMS
jgi:hypothetical protein